MATVDWKKTLREYINNANVRPFKRRMTNTEAREMCERFCAGVEATAYPSKEELAGILAELKGCNGDE